MAKHFLLAAAILAVVLTLGKGAPLQKPGLINDLAHIPLYDPEKPPTVPIELGERRK